MATAGDPDVHRGLERVPVRDHADVVARARARCRRRSRSSRARRSSSSRWGRSAAASVVISIPLIFMVLAVPEADRRRPHRRRGQGLGGDRRMTMAEIQLRECAKRYPDGFGGRQGHGPGHRRRRVHDPRRAVGLREVDRAADDRRARGHLRGRPADRRRAGQRPRAARPRHRDGLPELRAVPAHDRAREHGLRAQARQGRTRARSTSEVDEAAQILDLEAHLERKPANLSGGQRQRVAMGRAIVRVPKVVPDGRAAVEPRRQAARADAHRGRRASSSGWDDDGVRDARPDRGDDAGRPRGGHARRRHPAGRHAEEPLREPAQPVRGRLHRLAVDELPAGAARGRHDQAAVRRHAAARRAARAG